MWGWILFGILLAIVLFIIFKIKDWEIYKE